MAVVLSWHLALRPTNLHSLQAFMGAWIDVKSNKLKNKETNLIWENHQLAKICLQEFKMEISHTKTKKTLWRTYLAMAKWFLRRWTIIWEKVSKIIIKFRKMADLVQFSMSHLRVKKCLMYRWCTNKCHLMPKNQYSTAANLIRSMKSLGMNLLMILKRQFLTYKMSKTATKTNKEILKRNLKLPKLKKVFGRVRNLKKITSFKEDLRQKAIRKWWVPRPLGSKSKKFKVI